MTRAVPHTWGYIAWGTTAVTVGAIACVLILTGAKGSMRRDLIRDTRAELDRMEQVLRENAIPATNIARGTETIRRDARASWAFAAYTVKIPDEMNVEGVANVLRRRLRHGNVTVANGPRREKTRQELLFAMDNRPFATVRVERGVAAGPFVARYVQASERAVDDVVRALRRALPPWPEEKSSVPVPRSNRRAVWSFVRVDIGLTSPYDPIKARAAFAKLPRDVAVGRVASDSPHTTVLSISYKGLPCGEIALNYDARNAVPDVPHILKLANAALHVIPPTLISDAMAPQRGHARPRIRALQPGTTPRMAIIVDDGGYYAEATDRILALDSGLTLSILPFAPLSEYTASRGTELGFEIMLHMPMASFNSIHNAPGYIAPDMEPDEIEQRLDAALEAIPTAIGLNNHTGSKYTSNEKAMEILLNVVKGRSLYFIDSRTTKQSRALEVALRMRVPTVPRDLFLDNSPSIPAIRARFDELIRMALTHGTAVGICHFRPNTAAVLEEVLPKIREQGIEIVHVSQLLP